MDIEYRHTAQVRRDSWFIKMYYWLWMAEADPDFCKLFWGFVLAPFNLFVRVIGFPFYLLWRYAIRPLARRINSDPEPEETDDDWWAWSDRQKKRRAEAEARRRALKRLWAARFERMFGWIGVVIDKIIAGAQAAWPTLRWLVYGLASVFALALTAGLGYVVFLVVTVWPPWFLVVLLVFGGAAIVGGLLAGTVFVFVETKPGQKTTEIVRGGTLGFFGALGMGIRGIKSRTCPKIDLVD